MKRTKMVLLLGGMLLTLLVGGASFVWVLARNSSIATLTANPQGDARPCLRSPSSETCSVQVSPFGTGAPGAASCAARASVPALAQLSDPTEDEAPLAQMQVWQSPLCHATFASAYTSSLLGFQGAYTMTLSIARLHQWWQPAGTYQTRLRSSGRPSDALHIWTSLLLGDAPEKVEACVAIDGGKSYHLCTVVTLEEGSST